MSETTTSSSASSALKAIKLWLGISGVIALITGIVIVAWPGQSAIALTIVLAVYALIAGVVYIVTAIFGSGSGWLRVGHALAGIVFIVAAIVAFMNPAASAASLAIVVAIFIGVAWIFEGIAALSTLSLSASKGWSVFFAIVSILGGIALLMAPLFAAAFLLMWVGVTLIVLGVVGIIRAFMIK